MADLWSKVVDLKVEVRMVISATVGEQLAKMQFADDIFSGVINDDDDDDDDDDDRD